MDWRYLETKLHNFFRGESAEAKVDDADVADYLEGIRREDEEKFFAYLMKLPEKLRAETVVELPRTFQLDLAGKLEPEQLAVIVTQLESDDAADFMQIVRQADRTREAAVFDLLEDRLQRTIRGLMRYGEDEAGSLMQTELFHVHEDETILNSLKRLRRMKASGELESVQQVFVVDDNGKLVRLIPLEELILIPARKKYIEVLADFEPPLTVTGNDPVEDAVRIIERYDVSVVAVVDEKGHLLGRITHDDALDEIQEMATEQMYGISQVGSVEEMEADATAMGRSRAIWLFLNLINVTLVSAVIGLFEETLDKVVALAVLMPIVANMAGASSVQTLTVLVRQMALGEVDGSRALSMIGKELRISAFNGVLFGLLAMGISYYRFGSLQIGLVIGGAMVASFLFAGLLGTGVPLLLRRVGADPAVASSVVVIALVDVVGFFSFLWLASMFVL